MKVRCIDDLGTTVLEVGRVYDGNLKFDHWNKEKRWFLEGEKFRKFCFREKAFEIVREDNKMQEKTFREVIADIKEREVWICEKFNRKIIKSDDGVIEIRKLNDETFDNVSALIFNDEKYKLQRKEYTFKEAFKAYEEGKEIESCKTGYRYKKINGEDGFYSKFSGEWIEDDITFNCEEIRSSWYINY